jgi:hypothetical protein
MKVGVKSWRYGAGNGVGAGNGGFCIMGGKPGFGAMWAVLGKLDGVDWGNV